MFFFFKLSSEKKISETNNFCNFPFTSRTMTMPEVKLAVGDPLMPDTQGSHKDSKRGGGQHTLTHILTAAVCTVALKSSQCLVCKLLHVSWKLYCRDWFSDPVCKCITALWADFNQWLGWPVSIHHRRRRCRRSTAALWVSVGTAVNVAPWQSTCCSYLCFMVV